MNDFSQQNQIYSAIAEEFQRGPTIGKSGEQGRRGSFYREKAEVGRDCFPQTFLEEDGSWKWWWFLIGCRPGQLAAAEQRENLPFSCWMMQGVVPVGLLKPLPLWLLEANFVWGFLNMVTAQISCIFFRLKLKY